MYIAKDVMTSKLVTVKKTDAIFDAMRVLVDHNITGLPVVNNAMEVVGIVSEKDMLRVLNNPDDARSIEDIMTTNVVSFDEDDDLQYICECLVKSNFRRVPILAGQKLVGIISRRDIIRFYVERRRENRHEI